MGEEEKYMTHNRRVLAQMEAIFAVDRARRGPQQSARQQLLVALEDAIADGRERRDLMAAAGGAGSEEYLQLNAKIARWESARRSNR